MPDKNSSFHFFWSGPFSQWQASGFVFAGETFSTAEQAMMHQKALLFGDVDIAVQILAAKEPGKQKALGRQVRNFDQDLWDSEKYPIVRNINLAKFRQNKGLRRKLFQTGAKILVEASPMDTIWGIGLDAEAAQQTEPENWPGQNLLGRALMEVRDQLRLEFPTETVAADPA